MGRAAASSAPGLAAGEAGRLLDRLEWTVLKRLDGLLEGDYRSLFRGAGMDLADLREYQLHDDVRHIDWNVTARLQTPHVREFHQDRELTAWFLLDLSPSIDFGAREVCKRDLLQAFVAVLARLLTRHGNRVGLVFYDRDIEAVIPPRSGRAHVLQALHRLMSRRPEPGRAGGRRQAGLRGTELGPLLRRAAALAMRRSQVFVVSDFLCEPGWTEPLGQLAQRHEVLGVRLVDPLERELPDLGIVVMQDAETGEQLTVDTHDGGFRRRFMAQAQAREMRLRMAFADAGVDVLELSTDEDLVDSIRRFVGLRRLRARMAAGGGSPQTARTGGSPDPGGATT